MTAAIIDCSCAQSPTSTLILDRGGCGTERSSCGDLAFRRTGCRL